MPADLIFDNLRSGIADGTISWTGDTLECLIVQADTWAPDAGDVFVDDILTAGAIEAASPGDRQGISSTAVTAATTPDHRAYLTADAISYPNITNGTAFDSLVVYKLVTNDGDSPVLGLFSLGVQVGDGTNVDLTPDANGYFAL